MIRSETFWEDEKDAPLLNRNAGYINPQSIASVVDRANKWIDMVTEKVGSRVELAEWRKSCPDAAAQRIFELDAERTFKAETNRRDHIETLSTIFEEVNDYHQGMGFIVAFLLLFVSKEDAARLVLGLHRFYVPGYFKAAPVSYVRDAKVYEQMLEKRFPEVHKKVTSLIPGEAYCSKWFVGFNVHVLPFKDLSTFLDNFFTKGVEFHFQFAMALIKNTEEDLLEAKDVGKLLEILRLDSKVYPDSTTSESYTKKVGSDLTSDDSSTNAFEGVLSGNFFTKIVQDAIDINLDEFDIEAIRTSVLEDMEIADELRREKDMKLDEESDGIVFSDEED